MPRNFRRRAFLRRIDQREALMQVEFEPGALNRRPTGRGGGSEKPERIMSDEFDGLDATEKAAIGVALNRCRALAAKIANELRSKGPEHFVDKLSLADIRASLERAADVLSTVKGSRARHRR
jgi:hypothetical protein